MMVVGGAFVAVADADADVTAVVVQNLRLAPASKDTLGGR